MLRLVVACCLLGMPFASEAQQAAKVFHVGLLSIGTDPTRPVRWQPFFEAMRELNYIEGRNLVIKPAFGDGRFDRLAGLAADLVKAKVDVIVATGDREIDALRRVTDTIPIVMTFVVDPVGKGYVASLARPGRNITGFTSLVPGISQKYVELLREVIPTASRFAVVATPANTGPVARRDFETAAKAFGMSVFVANVSDRESYAGALARVKKGGAAGIIAPMDGETFRYRQDLVQLAMKENLPGIYGDRGYVEEGGLMSYSSSFAHRLRRAATYVDRILRGAKPADLPIEQPTRFELVINMKTARALGVTIPRSMLVRADEVIE